MNELEKQTNTNLTLVERLRLKRSESVLILDTSASMKIDIEPGKSRISALRDIVQSTNFSGKIISFNSVVTEITRDTIPEPSGVTNLTPALNLIKSQGYKSCVILTDGDISDKDETLAAKENLDIKVMYIGSGQRPEFLDKLASAGYATTEDLKQQKALSTKIQLLLGSGEVKKGAIEL